jgi:hypothetical protein
MATLWSDDFESGNALAVSYRNVADAETNATCGRGGGWGCRTTGTNSAKYYGGFVKRLAAEQVGLGWWAVQIDTDTLYATLGAYGSSLFEVRDSAYSSVWMWSLYIDGGDRANQLSVYSAFGGGWSTPVYQCDDFITPGTWQTIRLEWKWSTLSGPASPNADGCIRILRDDIEIWSASNLVLCSRRGWAVGDAHQFDEVYVGPMGNGDNLGIYSVDAGSIEILGVDSLALVLEERTVPTGSMWVDIPDFLNVKLSDADFPGLSARLQCELWAEGGVTMQARLLDVTTGLSCGESAAVASAVPLAVEFPVTLVSGQHVYRLQVGSTETDVDLWCAGTALLS